jgi:hypothetical protein
LWLPGSAIESSAGAGWLFRFIRCHTGFPCVCISLLLSDVLIIDNTVELMETHDKNGDGKAKDEDSECCSETSNKPAAPVSGILSP